MTTLSDVNAAPAVGGEVVSFELAPATIAKLARGYARSLAERLDGYGLDPAAGPPQRRAIDWLHPRSVWAARIGTSRPGELEASRAAVASDLARGEDERPWVEHLAAGRDPEPWSEWAVTNLQMHTGAVDPTIDIRFTAQPLEPIVDRVSEAFGILWRVWPQAAIENHLLVRSHLYVEGGEFQSATFEDVFGAVMVGIAYVDTVPGAFEMLLHEGGHHSLFLRNVYATFVTNGGEMVHHPLRHDPRPIKGAVHAAHSLGRMATGLAQWCAGDGAPQEAFRRRDNCVANFRTTLAVIGEHACWTPAGEQYFANLMRASEALPEAGEGSDPGWE